MVMRNRNDNSGARHWWDDLPPHVRHRFRQALTREDEPPAAPAADPEPAAPVSRGALLLDLSRLAIMFILIALGNILFLLLALSFLNS